MRDVRVEPADNGETLLISIDYEARATNNVFNLVYRSISREAQADDSEGSED